MSGSRRAYKLNLIGGFELSFDGEAQDLPEPGRRLVAFLGLHRKPQARVFVAGSLWPDKREARALANLRSALWTLHAASRPPVVVADGPLLSVCPGVQLDVRHVQDEGWNLVHQPGNTAGALESDLALDKDLLFEELLPGWYDDWLLLERERFTELQLHVLDVLVEAFVVGARHPQAINMALRLVALDPLRERSQLALIRSFLAEGSFGRAHRQYLSFCDVMRSTFGRPYGRSFEEVCEGP